VTVFRRKIISKSLMKKGEFVMTLNELEKRIQILEDIEEIKKLQIHYVNCLITTNWDDLIDCFTDEAVTDTHSGVGRGKAEISNIFKKMIARYHIGQEGNFLVHPIITVDGDKAKGSWLLYMQFAQPRKLLPRLPVLSVDDAPDWMQGFYDIEYQKVDNKWKISYLKWNHRLISPMTLLKDYKTQ
jgi:hypothetical protein